MKMYISGPITGCKNQNREAFAKAKRRIEAVGDTAVNPHDIGDWAEHDGFINDAMTEEQKHAAYMREDLKALLDCDAILMLKKWGDSKGALIEHSVAKAVGMTVFYQ